MSRWSTDGEQVMRDLVVAFKHPDYRDQRPIEAYQQLKRDRGDL